ncbi:serine protease [Actinacidiphila paucisporea]|uniref:Trypsin-like peptidase domain-containing protein n=1 Tax=Actinacidiphila paucisporea TaxID=310782 RepID=A0A1M7QWG8_9ACTN|nr:serine protease [Actinacidiphila paucisporea]SHN36212.1 Trypsin-like peptidase domain-containing protein [Actinacidiphila paucisporea]
MRRVRDGLDPRRAVQVLADRDGTRALGSGYQVTADLVLTAEHVVTDAQEVTIRFIDGPGRIRETHARTVWAHARVDLAVLRLDTPTADVAPVRYGRLDEAADCAAVGYPWFKLRRQYTAADEADPGIYRESHHARGSGSPHSNRRTGTLELAVIAPPAHPDPDRSAWEGMSGAAVFANRLLIGVLSENHVREGPGWLTANPVTAWYPHPPDRHFTTLHALLGLPPAQRLPTVGPAPERRDIRAGLGVTLTRRDTHIHVHPRAAGTTAHAASAPKYLKLLAESYQWLELQGIREAGSLRIELEKVYVALKAEPESEYDLRHLANLHAAEVQEAAGGTALDLIEPTQLAELDAQNVRQTYRPKRDEDRRAKVTEVQTIADAFRLHNRAVLLGNPGSGKTTLGRWLALQLARGMLAQLRHEVTPESVPDQSGTVRIHVPPGKASSLSKSHFVAALTADRPSSTAADKPVLICLDRLPVRGRLALFDQQVKRGQTLRLDQVEQLTYTPAGTECGNRYAHLRYSAGVEGMPSAAGAIVIDVGVRILVPLSQIDPDQPGGPDSDRPVDLGPARVPIFLRLAHFARELAERDRDQRPTIPLIDYLGCDPDSSGLADGGSPKTRNAMLCEFLDRNSAVVILDGLDELPETNRRTVLLKIQQFLETATEPNAPDEAGMRWRSPGNQVLVTSRYVGYKLMPLRSGCAHFGIQPMQRPAVEHFARAWTRAVSAELGAERPDRPTAEALIAEIYDDARPAIRELATNPLLITILATVYWADGRLPDQRAGVYDRVVENLLTIWLNRPECLAQTLQRHELLAALEPLAAQMQADHGSNGLVSLDRIAELIEGPLARMRHANPSDRTFKPVLDALLVTIRKHVGLLAEQSSGNYAFFHRTFQEFLAARHLLSEREHAAERIVERLDDPLWREPLLLALGLLTASPEWGPETRTRLLEGVLAGDDRDPLIPRSAMLVVSALPTLDKVPQRVIDRIVGQLLSCYAFSQRQAQAEKLREEIRKVLARLRDGPAAEAVAEAVCEAIRQSAAEHDLAGAAAEILLRLEWFTTSTVDAMLSVIHRDEAGLGWPVHWALLAALGQSAAGQAPVRSAAALNAPRLVASNLPMRRLLESRPDLTAFARGDTDWLWLLIALYGGLGRTRVGEKLLAHQKRQLDEVRSDEDDATDESAADLPPLVPPIAPIDFCPGDIVHDLADAELGRSVLRQLRARRPARELADLFLRIWQRGADPAGRAEGLVGLAALGQDVVPLVHGALADGQGRPAARAALDRFRWLRALLREPVVRSTQTAARTLPTAASAERRLDLLRIVIEARAAAGGGPLAVSDTIPALRFVGTAAPDVRDGVDAEEWAFLFSGLAEQALDEAGAGVDAQAVVDLRAPGRVARGWAEAARARNHRARPRLWWPQRILAPRCDTPVERYLAVIDGLVTAPPECDRLAGHVLARCGPVLDAEPGLVWETLALCHLRGNTFTAAYLVSATGERVRISALTAAAADLVSRWDRGRLAADQAEELRTAVETTFLWLLDEDSALPRNVLDSARVLLRHAVQIGNPYLRFRALWLLSGIAGLEPVAVRRTGPDLIADPHDRARALEWILMTIPGMRTGLHLGQFIDLDEVIRRFLLIQDPENRARAQCRLAMLVPERLGDLLDAAAASVGRIADPVRRAETIEEIRFTLGGIARLAPGFEEAAESLPDQWLRDKALGRTSRLIAGHRADFGAGALVWQLTDATGTGGATEYRRTYPTGVLPWGVLYLNATAAEVGALEATTAGDTADWELLLGSEWQSGVDALIDSAADGALSLTMREASVVSRIIQAGRSTVLDQLWGYLECPEPRSLAIATRWSTADPSAERWKALVQAESGVLTPESMDLLVEMLCEATDRLRQRVVLALHGPTPWGNNRNRRWSVSRVGVKTIEAIAGHSVRVDYAPQVVSPITWMQCDIHHDDAEALHQWLAEAAADPHSAAGWILKSLESVDESLVASLLEALPSLPAAAQRKLLVGLGQMAISFRVLESSAQALQSAIAAVPAHVRREVWFIPEGAVACLRAVAAAAAWPDEGSRLDVARDQIERSKLWLDDNCVKNPADCYRRLGALGDSYYVYHRSNGYWDKATEAAAELAENEIALRVLLSWLESLSFAESSTDLATDLVAFLLTAADALARVSPNAYTALADPDVWEPILTEWVETADHWTARLSALRLLGLLRRVTPRVTAALRAAMKDNFHVQQAAYDTVQDFHSMKGDITAELIESLGDADAGVAGSTARLLLNLARGEGATTDRRRILRGLQEAASSPTKGRNMYMMSEGEIVHTLSIRFVDRLDRLLYQAIFEISGL